MGLFCFSMIQAFSKACRVKGQRPLLRFVGNVAKGDTQTGEGRSASADCAALALPPPISPPRIGFPLEPPSLCPSSLKLRSVFVVETDCVLLILATWYWCGCSFCWGSFFYHKSFAQAFSKACRVKGRRPLPLSADSGIPLRHTFGARRIGVRNVTAFRGESEQDRFPLVDLTSTVFP